MSRQANIERITGETEVTVTVDLDGQGHSADTGVGFFDHMLDLLARHANIGLVVSAKGDLDTGSHHTVEDVGIVIGQAISEALGDRTGIRRYGHAVVPMDEAIAECCLDFSGRPLSVFRGEVPVTSIGNFETELAEEFFGALANGGRLTLHTEIRYGTNVHHMIEAAFKALARAVRVAVEVDPAERGVPSTKGTLTS
ncbi:MAG: imidazoleglycerol-phosphate dehydratase HisB [Solirubrobacterales bacterium]|nr:imidazoleglycerol-phosphate dehydratase HisB [Solirubrobacterales bacterium]